MKPLSVKNQIKVLQKIHWDTVTKYDCGLCCAISFSMIRLNLLEIDDFDNEDLSKLVREHIPIFTIENASKYIGVSSTDSDFWWDQTEEGNKSRKEFVEWMISELKKQLKNGNTDSTTTNSYP